MAEPARTFQSDHPAAANGNSPDGWRERSRWLARHVLPHEPALRAWLKGKLAPDLEADDIVQETYAVLSALRTVEHIDAPRAYAFQVAWSLNNQHIRRIRIAPMEALDTANVDPFAPDPSPEQQVAARDALRAAAAIIDALPDRCREALLLRRIEGLSQRETSRRMGISESTVEKHIGRALRALTNAVVGGALGLG